MADVFGPTFGDELAFAGVPVGGTNGLDGWNSSGTIWGREKLIATDQTKLDAVIAAHNPTNQPSKVTAADVIGRFTNAEYMALLNQQKVDLAAGVIGNVKNWDTMMATPSINMADRRIKAVKNNLVSSGVLTQARADVIFS